MTWIAEETVLFVHPDGRRVTGKIAVGLPTVVSDREGRCEVLVEGLGKTPYAVLGNGSLQPLLLAVQNLGMRLHAFLEDGGRLLHPETGEDFGIESYFGPLLAPVPGRSGA